eukprot:15457341-Alexandrium_andersonii.AAC.1
MHGVSARTSTPGEWQELLPGPRWQRGLGLGDAQVAVDAQEVMWARGLEWHRWAVGARAVSVPFASTHRCEHLRLQWALSPK